MVVFPGHLGPQEGVLAFLIASGTLPSLTHPVLASPLETGPSPSSGRVPQDPCHPCCSPPWAPGRPSLRSHWKAMRRWRTATQVRVHGEEGLLGGRGGQETGAPGPGSLLH